MGAFNKIKQLDFKRIGYHVLFWAVITVSYDLLAVIMRGGEFGRTLLLDLAFYTPSDVLGAYFVLYVLIPRFLLKKKYVLFGVLTVLWLAVMLVFIAMPFQYLGLTEVFGYDKVPSYWYYFRMHLVEMITIKFMITGVASSIKIAKIWIATQKRQQKLIKEKLETELKLREAELKFLKSQINPHFLFNALNNLYSLTLSKSDKAPEVVLKISSLLDYVLYECNVPYIELEREAESIKNYIDLQKMRYGQKVNIKLHREGNAENVQIAPLLILPLIENAFKHGLDKSLGEGFVYISLKANKNKLQLTVRNSLKGENNHDGKGIGLKNLKKRLELQYPERYSFSIKEEKDEFIADLSLKIE